MGKDMLSVIITAKNNASTLKSCVEKVLRAPPKDKEVIIVYGKSRDDTEKIARSFGEKVKIVEDNAGTGSAINSGVLTSKGDIIFYVEGHSFVSEDAFQKVLSTFKKYPDVGYIVFYRYVPTNLCWTSIQKLINLWRKENKNSTMGQFRAFRKETFFDIGGFWIFPNRRDDLEFATRIYNTRWKMKFLHAKCWDYPRTGLLPILFYNLTTGAAESCWFHIYFKHPYAKKEYKVKKHRLIILFLLYKIVLKRLFLSPMYALKVAITRNSLAFFPFYSICQWMFVLGFIYGQLRWWGKEKWDKRVMRQWRE